MNGFRGRAGDLFLLGLATLVQAHAAAGGAPAGDEAPAYVARGRLTEAHQHAYHERIERFYRALSDRLRTSAPDLLATLAAPPPDVYGYGILPKLVADAPQQSPGTPAVVVSFSWGWSETLIEQETAALGRLEAEVTTVPPDADRAQWEKLVAEYRKAIDRRKPIDADIQYNWLWQARIDRDRPLFDRLKKVQDAVLDHQAIESALKSPDEAKRRSAAAARGLDPTASAESLRAALLGRARSVAREIAEATPQVDPPGFARIERSAGGSRVVTVPLCTDIADAAFVQAFRDAVESVWRVRVGSGEFRLRLAIETITPEQLYCGPGNAAAEPAGRCAPPANGDAIDPAAHVAHFPGSRAVLTTGATTLQVVSGRAIVLSPLDVTPHVLAHEFGHVLGFPDTYRRGYRDHAADGYEITELGDETDIMGAPGAGPVLARHFEELSAALDVQDTMRAGLDALYLRDDPTAAVARFREVRANNPAHYGATLQLAKALDRSGRPEEALVEWKKILAMAEAVSDADTIAAARARIAGR